jgi:hypothetical protein
MRPPFSDPKFLGNLLLDRKVLTEWVNECWSAYPSDSAATVPSRASTIVRIVQLCAEGRVDPHLAVDLAIQQLARMLEYNRGGSMGESLASKFEMADGAFKGCQAHGDYIAVIASKYAVPTTGEFLEALKVSREAFKPGSL